LNRTLLHGRRESLEAAIDAYHERASLCGAIRISRNGAVLLERVYGKASVQLGVDNHLSTRFHIASVTKMFISAAVVRLACEGRVSLHDHPSNYLPGLSSLDARITIHHLLSHTSGLADVYGGPDLRPEMIRLAKSGGRLFDYLVAQLIAARLHAFERSVETLSEESSPRLLLGLGQGRETNHWPA